MCLDVDLFVSCAGTFSVETQGIPDGKVLFSCFFDGSLLTVLLPSLPTDGLLGLLDWSSDFYFPLFLFYFLGDIFNFSCPNHLLSVLSCPCFLASKSSVLFSEGSFLESAVLLLFQS